MGERQRADSTAADFRMPDENNFEQLPTPELKPGMHEFKSIHHETLELMKHSIADEKQREIYQHERSHTDPKNPTAENRNSDWQKFNLEFDDQNRVTKERSQRLLPGKEDQTYLEHSYGEDGSQSTTGRIEAGPDAGHAWRKSRRVLQDFGDGRRIIEEKTDILEQGNNPTKPGKDASFKKEIYMKVNTWLGEESTDQNTGETSVFLPGGAESLPDWTTAA